MAVAARIYLLVGACLIALYVATGGNEELYVALGQVAWLAILVGVAINRPRRRGGWYLLAAGTAALSTGDLLYFEVYGNGLFPSAADGLYLLGDVILGVSLLALVGGLPALRRDALALADAGVLALGLGLVLWSTFFSGRLGSGSGLAHLVSIAYPVFDLALLAVLMSVLLTRGTRTLSYWLTAGVVLLLVLDDAWYVVPALTSHYVAGTWRDIGWLGSYVLAGAAALDPSMRTFTRRRYGQIATRRVVLLGGALLLVAVAAVLQQAVDGRVNVIPFAICGGLMAIFVTMRVAGLVRQLERTSRQAEASERRFRMIFEHSPIGISVGRDGIMSETNPALHRMLGYTAEEFGRMHYTDVTHPDDRALAEQLELDAGTRRHFSIDKRYTRKDGSSIDAHVNVALDIEGGLGISLIEDVTHRRALEDQLRQSQKMEAIGKLAGGIAHDFNNLMTAVLGYSDLLLKRMERGDPQREKVEAIRDSASRASDLTRQLLAFGRRQMLQVSDVDLRDVVARMDSLLRRLIGEDVVLETVFGTREVCVRADPTQLEQVVMNLAVNARDAMPSGGTLTISVLSTGDAAVLSVADSGTGIEPQILSRIFEPFFTTKPVGEGSGLGLSTVHGIVGQSGGAISVDSAPGEGTVFAIRLPLAGRPPLFTAGDTAGTLVLTD